MATSLISPSSVTFMVIALLGYSDASSYFKPQCSLPPDGTNYVAGANTRSTLGILWDCLSIIILCTWNIQHLNVPAIQRRPATVLGRMWQAILNSTVKIKWMVFTILVPEFLVGKALGERAAARYASRWPMDQPTVTHAYLANMGYFVLDCGDPADAKTEEPERSRAGILQEAVGDPESINVAPKATDLPAGNEPARDLEAQPAASRATKADPPWINDVENLRPHARLNLQRLHPSHRYWALNAYQWYRFRRRQDFFVDWVDFTVDQLEKLDRGGTLVKALALIQVSYLILQLIARQVVGLPSTQLEITALAFAACSILTYLFYWNRPQGVETVHIVKAKMHPDANWGDLMKLLIEAGPRYLWYKPRSTAKFDPTIGPAPIPNDCSHYTGQVLEIFSLRHYGANDEILYLAIGALAGGSVFGCLHCLAWNFDFPTQTERLLWRICAVMITCLPPLAIVPLVFWMKLHPVVIDGKGGSLLAKTIVGSILLFLFLIPYVLARLFLLVEVFRSLFFLPPEAFVDTWSGSFPHWG